jgi:hypothetical protein
MPQQNTRRFWNHFALGTLVLLVTGAAFCTVAASASVRGQAPAAAFAQAGP